MKLRQYQEKTVADIRIAMKQGHNRIIMQLPTGAGKTVVFSYMVKQSSDRGLRCLILTDRVELLEQAGGTFDEFEIDYENVTAKTRHVPKGKVLVAMVETMKRRAKNRLDFAMMLKTINLVIIDECFVAGTKVSDKKIEDIKIGDIIESYNHNKKIIENKKVVNVFKNRIKNDLLLVKYNYDFVICTQKHPIFVIGKNYIEANKLKIGDRIYVRNFKQGHKPDILFSMQKGNKYRNKRKKEIFNVKTRFKKTRFYLLLHKLFSIFKIGKNFDENENKQSNEKRGISFKNVGNFKKNWTQASNSRRKRKRNDNPSEKIIRKTWRRLVSRISNYYRKWLFTLSLQNRHRQSNEKNSNRNRWRFSLFAYFKKKRSKKNESFRIERIQSIEILKQSDFRKYGLCDSDNFVYNLEVEDNNNYFANGVLVHNCHKNAFNEIFMYLNETCYVIGATATPIRTGKLTPLSDFFTIIIEGPSIQSLIEQGFLSKPEYFGVSVDLSSVKMKAGEFDESDQERVYSEVKVFEGLQHNLQLHAKGLKTMIFCPSVQSSLNVARDLHCLHVDGTMAPQLRDRVLTEFETTPGVILTNCGITTVGYDHPGIECIALYRATTSLPLYLQMVGRGSRVTDTKHIFKILDFGMNVQRFNYWHVDRLWTLENKIKKSKDKKDAFPIKFCPECGAIVAVNTKTCDHCGYVWLVTEQERVFAELQAMPYAEVQRRINEAATVEEMEQIRAAKGYKIGYLLHKFEKKEQFYEYERLKNYRPGWANIQLKNFNIK
jgi:superfamily II DNA or RNA helicase